MKFRAILLATVLLVTTLIVPEASFAQRGRGSFGGGGRSFGGGGGRSFGGGSPRTFSGGGASAPRTGGSFNRSGNFGGPTSNTRSQSVGGSPFRSSAPPVQRSNPTYIQHNTYINYGGYGGPVRMYGGWSDYSYSWVHPAWYFWTPFHPAFYYSPPVYVNGYYEPGGFSFFRLLFGLILIGGVFWVIVKIVRLFTAPRYGGPPPPPDVW